MSVSGIYDKVNKETIKDLEDSIQHLEASIAEIDVEFSQEPNKDRAVRLLEAKACIQRSIPEIQSVIDDLRKKVQ